MGEKRGKRRRWRGDVAEESGVAAAVERGCCLINAVTALAFVTAAGIIPLLMR